MKISSRKINLLLILVIALTVFRLLLRISSPWLVLIVGGGADDWYQDEVTLHILNGEWLGPYNWVTLSKGVSFPIFLAFIRKIGLSYGLGTGLFLIISVFIASYALFPILKRKEAFFALYIILLYSPIFFSPSSLQIYRNAIVPIVTLGVISGFIGIYLRIDQKLNKILVWSLIECFYFPFFWFLREDSIWLLPFCVAAGIISLIKFIYTKKKIRNVILLVVILIMPYLTCFAYKIAIEEMNYKYYGLKTTSDRSKTACSEVIDLIHRIDDPDNNDPDVWVSKKTIENALHASPTLAEISERLIETRDSWAGGEENELKGDLFEWVLRISYNSLGMYTDGEETNARYEKIAEELETAFENGELEKKKALFLSPQVGGLYPEDFLETLVISLKSFYGVLIYNKCEIPESVTYNEIIGEEYQIVQAEYLLGSKLNRTDEQLNKISNSNDAMNIINSMILKERSLNALITNCIIKVYKVCSLILSLVCLICLVYLLFKKNSELKVLFTNNIIWILGILVSAFINVYIVYLFTRFVSRDPMGEIVRYWAPSAYIFVEYAKLAIMVPVIRISFANWFKKEKIN